MWQKLPTTPGVYIYKNKAGEIIYVGKAINLRRRVGQYFQRDDALGPKTATLVSQIHKIDYHLVDSEVQALLLEASLIKKYKPKYNSQLRDDKSYIYICITREKYPRVFSTHKSRLNEKDDFYGPFPDGRSVRSILKILRRLYPYRSCRILPKKACLYFELGLCPAPCVQKTNYGQTIGKIRKFLNGNITYLITQTKNQIKQLSKQQNYEQALVLKNQLDNLLYITSGWQSASDLYKNHNLQEDQASRGLEQIYTTLKPFFPNLTKLNRLECFDISNLGNDYFVGSMTVFANGQLNPAEYRHFKIKTKANQDDMFMLKEVLYRRLQHPEWDLPDLIVLDGGKPQLSTVLPVIDKIPTVGLAKKFETIVIKVEENSFQEINLPKDSQGLFLLQNLRDEAHRFANAYRKKLIQKSQLV